MIYTTKNGKKVDVQHTSPGHSWFTNRYGISRNDVDATVYLISWGSGDAREEIIGDKKAAVEAIDKARKNWLAESKGN